MTNTIITPYDHDNIFARILRKEMACNIVLETQHSLAFHDIFPTAPVHILIIPKGFYTTADDFFTHAKPDEIMDWAKTLSRVIACMDLVSTGYRLVTNAGKDGGQLIPHFHMHLLGKRPLTTMG
jgi:histidine triad (HIT) family protein